MWVSFHVFLFYVKFYRSGVLNVPNCVSFKVTQSVVVIGYGASYGRDYWLIKNRFIIATTSIVASKYVMYRFGLFYFVVVVGVKIGVKMDLQ